MSMGLESHGHFEPTPPSLATLEQTKTLSLEPPIGQLEFDKITAMNEDELDHAFKTRHGLDTVFKKQSPSEGLRVEMKRIVLARLEDIPLRQEIAEWYGESSEAGADTINQLKTKLSKCLTDECKDRIGKVEKTLAREAAVLHPTRELQDIERNIQTAMKGLGLPTLTIKDLFKAGSIPPLHRAHGFADLEFATRFFLFQIQGFSVEEYAERFGSIDNIDARRLSVFKTRCFSEEAKAIIKEVGSRKF